MKIELSEITIRDLVENYEDNDFEGVKGFNGKLDIRPPYQREFVYKDKQRDAVIDTVFKGFPLNVMYWAKRDRDNFEVIDGQQRTISICQYHNSDFSFEDLYFHNLPQDKKDKFLDYKLSIYVCSGTESEKLDWFKTINIAGAELSAQELRNAVYHGPWVTDAKKYFSKPGCPAYAIGKDYLDGDVKRQKYLETAIKWLSENNIEKYMGEHSKDPTALKLWTHFQNVISWVDSIFLKKRKKMKGVDWGKLYLEYKDISYDPQKVEEEIQSLIANEEVQNQKGIYSYIFTRQERELSIRAFPDQIKQRVYEKQKGVCNISGKKLDISEMEADHITPWHEGGKTIEENCQMISKEENRRKSGK